MMERPPVPVFKPVGYLMKVGSPEPAAPSFTSCGEAEERRFILCKVESTNVNPSTTSAYYPADVNYTNPERSKFLPAYSYVSVTRNLRPADIGEDGGVQAWLLQVEDIRRVNVGYARSTFASFTKSLCRRLGSDRGATTPHQTSLYGLVPGVSTLRFTHGVPVPSQLLRLRSIVCTYILSLLVESSIFGG